MHRKILLKKVEDFAREAARRYPVSQVILYGSWLEGLAREDDEIDVAVIFEHLDDDLLEVREALTQLAAGIDPRIDPTIVESDIDDEVGFRDEVMKNGKVIYPA